MAVIQKQWPCLLNGTFYIRLVNPPLRNYLTNIGDRVCTTVAVHVILYCTCRRA